MLRKRIWNKKENKKWERSKNKKETQDKIDRIERRGLTVR